METEMTSTARQLVSKSAFAQIIGKSAARVSQYIGERKLREPALVGDKVDVELGKRQLAAVLSQTQQLGQGKVPVDDDGAEEASSPPTSTTANDQKRALAAKATIAELEAESRRRKLMAESGEWTPTEDARRAQAREMTNVFNQLESWIVEEGKALSLEFGGDERAVTIHMRKALNDFRARQAKGRREAAAAMPEIIAETERQAAE